jgi:uncharacterized protein YbcI
MAFVFYRWAPAMQEIIETAEPMLKAMVLEATGVKVLSLHHDISSVTGEKIIVATLVAPPFCRDAKKRWPA